MKYRDRAEILKEIERIFDKLNSLHSEAEALKNSINTEEITIEVEEDWEGGEEHILNLLKEDLYTLPNDMTETIKPNRKLN